MTFSELDLHRLTGRAGWAAERAALSETQGASLVALVKYPMSSERRKAFKFWLNEIFAQYVENFAKRTEMLQWLGSHGARARSACENAFERGPKLSTLVRDELKGVQRALREATNATRQLSPPASAAIRESFWRNRLAGCTQTRQRRNFRQTWQMAHNAFLHFQVACERMEGKQAQLSDQVQKELKKVVQALDLLRDAIEDLSKVTRDLLEEVFDRPAMGGTALIQQKFAIEDPLDHVLAWLAILKTTVERPQIEIKRGRDEAPKRALVGGLAELYRVMTGKEPGRVYLAAKSPRREAGDFLELVRTFVGYANVGLPQGVICGTISLSKVVRQELKKRKVAYPD